MCRADTHPTLLATHIIITSHDSLPSIVFTFYVCVCVITAKCVLHTPSLLLSTTKVIMRMYGGVYVSLPQWCELSTTLCNSEQHES